MTGLPSPTPRREGASDRADEVYAKLHALIVRGHLPPGARLTEVGASQRLGVSRTPVREAIQRLQHEGYVTVPANGRRAQPTVSPLTLGDARDLVRIVGALEGIAAYDAALLRGRQHADLVSTLRETNRRFRSAARARTPDTDLLYDLDEAFHQAIVDRAGSPRLRQMHRSIKPQAERYIRVYAGMLLGRLPAAIREHRAIVRAIVAGRAASAERAIVTNWRNGVEALSRVIQHLGERGPL